MLKGDYVAFSTALKLEKQLESSQLNAVSAKLEELFKPYLENLKRDTASCGGLEQITVKEVSYPKGKTDEAIAHLITSFKDHSKKPHEDTVKLIWINDEWLPSLDQ